ncbi:hypothetical protein GCM10010156_50600 [Planobispora rosea]|uniref:Uncharacterized protein n=1 Tax=Planobispora rosea TaxID=35762 RepID=A0A8J3RXZ0_PLARO|nr:hypothetical protein [Planobispora rosea]GGS85864.1 hypothetical protein GCM10010156_50600 [Planobispora rosea]GIH83333.1 hypothetical protein Pro02_17410 [Planobispora rosea]
MPHNICALVVAGRVDAERARSVGLHAELAHGDLTVFPIDHFFSAYWAAVRGDRASLDVPRRCFTGVFPRQAVLRDLVREVTGTDEPRFAIIQTEYHAGMGDQWAVAFAGERRLTSDRALINEALAALGVRASASADEFDVIGLGTFRSNPDHLDRYVDLCDELGV